MRSVVFLLLVMGAAFFVRVGFTIAFRGGLDAAPQRDIAGADSVEYDLLARNVVTGKGYVWDDGRPTSFRAPGFPLVLVALYSIVGISYPAAYLSFAGWGMIGVVAAYLLMRELTRERPARWAAVFAAFYPSNIYDCSYFFSEVVFAPCLGFGAWLLVRYVRTGSLPAIVGAGLLLGYAALTRSFGVLFLPVFGLYLCAARPHGWRAGILFGLSFAAVVAPWTVRNYTVHNHLVLIATNGGSTFYGANNDLVVSSPREYGNWVSTTRLPGRDLIDAQPDEVSHDKMEWKLGLDWVKQNPEKFFALGGAKVLRFWLPFINYPSFKRYLVINIVQMTPLLLLIGVGIYRTGFSREGRRIFAVPHLILFANLVMVLVFWGDPRFRDANVPILAAYAVAGVWWIRYRSDVFTSHPIDPAVTFPVV